MPAELNLCGTKFTELKLIEQLSRVYQTMFCVDVVAYDGSVEFPMIAKNFQFLNSLCI